MKDLSKVNDYNTGFIVGMLTIKNEQNKEAQQ
jgi:hypothetical protein